jgi:hypothetical protein
MYNANHVDTQVSSRVNAVRKTSKALEERRFCPSIFCFTDEIVVRCVSPQAQVWLLTDENDDASWMMMGGEPTCPHCGTTLLAVNQLR